MLGRGLRSDIVSLAGNLPFWGGCSLRPHCAVVAALSPVVHAPVTTRLVFGEVYSLRSQSEAPSCALGVSSHGLPSVYCCGYPAGALARSSWACAFALRQHVAALVGLVRKRLLLRVMALEAWVVVKLGQGVWQWGDPVSWQGALQPCCVQHPIPRQGRRPARGNGALVTGIVVSPVSVTAVVLV